MGSVTSKGYFLSCLLSDEARKPLVDSALAPAYLHIKRFSKHIHEILLAYVSKRHHLLTWQLCHTEVPKVYHIDPVVYVAWQEHYVPNVHKQKHEQVCKRNFINDVRLLLCQPGNHSCVHNKAWPEILVTTEDIERTLLQKSERFSVQHRLS